MKIPPTAYIFITEEIYMHTFFPVALRDPFNTERILLLKRRAIERWQEPEPKSVFNSSGKKKKDTKKQLALQKVGAELGARRSGFTPISQQSSHSACSAFRV